MTIAITIFIALAVMLLDFIAFLHLRRNAVKKSVMFSFLSIVLISNITIILTPVLMYSMIEEENSCYMMKISMCLLTLYLALSLPRLLLYIFCLPAKRKWLMWTGISLSSILFLYFLYSIFITRTNYIIKEIEIEDNSIPAIFNGYRLAFISDIHSGSMMNATEEIGEIVRIINNSNVDIVFFGGDMINIHHSEINSSQLDKFSRLKPRDGVFMVLGNHDTGAYIKNSDKDKRKANIEGLVHKVESAGWVVLRDSTIYVRRGDDSIAVTGVDYNEELLKYKHSMDAVKAVDFAALYKCVPDSIFNITLSHLPQLWYSLCDNGYSDLTLSGHIHAMQMKICSFSPARFMYKEWSGLYEKENGKLYINDGIGCVGYMARFGARPEITVIELSKK